MVKDSLEELMKEAERDASASSDFLENMMHFQFMPTIDAAVEYAESSGCLLANSSLMSEVEKKGVLKKKKEKFRAYLMEHFLNMDEQKRLSQVMLCLPEYLEAYPEKTEVFSEIVSIWKRISESITLNPMVDEKVDEKKLYETEPPSFEISEKAALIIYDCASKFYEAHKYEKAEDILILLTRIADKFQSAWLLLGFIRQFKKKYRYAVPPFVSAVVLDPEDPIANFHLAETYLALGLHLTAEEFFKVSLELMTDEQKSYYCLRIEEVNRILENTDD